ncbi:MAG: antibiotic biosynthesis monooxygenase [Myxococcales bacterium]|nr:antibiotic biosynthesis monooxygenase [Myxococcales bacterium]
MEDEVILINCFEVPPGEEALQAAIETWEGVRDFLKQQPGYIDTRLHRAIDPSARYSLVNVARWRSADAFRQAIGKLRSHGGPPTQPGLAANPALYTVIRTSEP